MGKKLLINITGIQGISGVIEVAIVHVGEMTISMDDVGLAIFTGKMSGGVLVGNGLRAIGIVEAVDQFITGVGKDRPKVRLKQGAMIEVGDRITFDPSP